MILNKKGRESLIKRAFESKGGGTVADNIRKILKDIDDLDEDAKILLRIAHSEDRALTGEIKKEATDEIEILDYLDRLFITTYEQAEDLRNSVHKVMGKYKEGTIISDVNSVKEKHTSWKEDYASFIENLARLRGYYKRFDKKYKGKSNIADKLGKRVKELQREGAALSVLLNSIDVWIKKAAA